MATKKRTTQPVKLTAAEAREKVEELQYKLDKYAGTAHCPMCNKHKDIETKSKKISDNTYYYICNIRWINFLSFFI